jgi:hypothetical protein
LFFGARRSTCFGYTNLSFPWSGSPSFSTGKSKPPSKTTQRLEPAASRILRVLNFLIAIVLLSTTRIPLRWLYLPLWPPGFWPFWLGAALTVAGILFAAWAREHLGSNWSRSVTIKQGHELIHHRSLCSGPSPNLQRHSDRVSWHRDCNLPGVRVLRLVLAALMILTHTVTVQASRKTIPRPQVPIQHFSAHPELQAKIAKAEPLD